VLLPEMGQGDSRRQYQAGVIAAFRCCNGCMRGTVRVASRLIYQDEGRYGSRCVLMLQDGP
jgi:hypothetical protein